MLPVSGIIPVQKVAPEAPLRPPPAPNVAPHSPTTRLTTALPALRVLRVLRAKHLLLRCPTPKNRSLRKTRPAYGITFAPTDMRAAAAVQRHVLSAAKRWYTTKLITNKRTRQGRGTLSIQPHRFVRHPLKPDAKFRHPETQERKSDNGRVKYQPHGVI